MGRMFGRGAKKRLGEILVEDGIVTDEQVSTALEEQKKPGNEGMKLGDVLVDMGYVTDMQMAAALSRQLGYEKVNLSQERVSDTVIKLANESILRKYSVMPFGYSERNANVLKMAMSDPLDIRAVDDMMVITGCHLEIYITTQRDIAAAIDRYYGNAEAMKMAQQFSKEREERVPVQRNLTEQVGGDSALNDAPIVKLVQQVVEQAVHKRASDIHIEPFEEKLRIRFRIDGVLEEEMVHDIELHAAMIARIKIVSGMDISEKRKPQDGRMTAMVDRQEYDIRVSMLPTVYGEKVVMRLTLKKGLTKDKKELGFTDEALAKFDKILSHPNGIILVTGPTGSGKSTTLYTALSELNTEGVNIVTVEDPVEANINGINQVQVNEKAGLTFASALRSILRQDPDIIMIGEIRDQETAEIAVKASITGHLVVSTLHTNSAANTITRLADMGVETYLLADSVVGVIAQRLVRCVCPDCSSEYEADEREKEILGIKDSARKITLRKAHYRDCLTCNGTGYRGRKGVYEIMEITPELRQAISKGMTADEIEEIALREGMKTLRGTIIEEVLAGNTTMDELKRVTYDE